MKVYLVCVSDCESTDVRCVCKTKAIAVRELFKVRDKLIEEWKELDKETEVWRREYCEEEKVEYYEDDMYKRMIKNLSSDDYEKWDNYPHDVDYIDKREIIEE